MKHHELTWSDIVAILVILMALGIVGHFNYLDALSERL